MVVAGTRLCPKFGKSGYDSKLHVPCGAGNKEGKEVLCAAPEVGLVGLTGTILVVVASSYTAVVVNEAKQTSMQTAACRIVLRYGRTY